MNATVLLGLRLYFKTLERLAPSWAGRHAYRLFSTPRRRPPVPKAVEAVMGRAEHFEVEVKGHQVAAYQWRARTTDVGAPRVMLAHGWESRAARLAVWVDPLLEAGFEVVSFDAPAHGASSGRRSNPGLFAASILAVVDRVGSCSVMMGHSLGGLSSIFTLGAGAFLGHDDLDVDRLLVVAGADSGVDAMAMFCDVLGLGGGFLPLILAAAAEEAGRPVADFDAHRLLANRPIPTLWFHAPENRDVPLEAAERVADCCPHVTLERMPGLGHRRIVRDAEVIRRGVAFLKVAFLKEGATGVEMM